jgi:hypothetical protein
MSMEIKQVSANSLSQITGMEVLFFFIDSWADKSGDNYGRV